MYEWETVGRTCTRFYWWLFLETSGSVIPCKNKWNISVAPEHLWRLKVRIQFPIANSSWKRCHSSNIKLSQFFSEVRTGMHDSVLFRHQSKNFQSRNAGWAFLGGLGRGYSLKIVVYPPTQNTPTLLCAQLLCNSSTKAQVGNFADEILHMGWDAFPHTGLAENWWKEDPLHGYTTASVTRAVQTSIGCC